MRSYHFAFSLIGAALASFALASEASHLSTRNATLSDRDLITFDESNLAERDVDWFDVDVGIMMERRAGPEEHSSILSRRAHPETRDLIDREVVELHLNTRGKVVYPRSLRDPLKRSMSKKKKHGKVHKKSKGKSITKTVKNVVGAVTSSATFSAIITWYTGHDLLGPSCVSRHRWAPTDKSLVAALTINWPGGSGKPKCGSYLRLRKKGGSKSILVRVVDSCGGCAANTAHVDLTKRAFTALYALDIGLVSGIQVSVLKKDPFLGRYTRSVVATYGPAAPM